MKGHIQKLLAGAAANDVELVIDLPLAQQCEHCNGIGFINVRSCDNCAGAGSFEHGNHTYGCKECGENGEIHTPSTRQATNAEVSICCDGHGTTAGYIGIEAAGVTHQFQEKYLRLISELPGSRLYAGKTNLDAARFEFEGGGGLVNPCHI